MHAHAGAFELTVDECMMIEGVSENHELPKIYLAAVVPAE